MSCCGTFFMPKCAKMPVTMFSFAVGKSFDR